MKPETILETCANEYGVSVSDLKSYSRKRIFCDARNTAMSLMRKYFGDLLTLEEIGELIGGRHHVTVINQSRQAENLMTDISFRKHYESITNKLYRDEII